MTAREPSPGGLTVTRSALLLLAALAALGVALNRLPFAQRPALAAALWRSHPDALRDGAMRDIGLAAAVGQAVPGSARAAMRRLATIAPLRPEPFLVEATIAATAGDNAAAEALFREAAARDPRSILAHYSLADRYLRTNRLVAGLGELSALARLVPNAIPSLTPALVAAARQPGSQGALRYFFARSPQLAPAVLAELAKDPGQSERVLALSQGLRLPADGNGWKTTSISTPLERRDYARAFATWRALAGVAPYHGLYNPGFRPLAAPPPFNWSPAEGNAALVEPIAGGGLNLVYYGREDALITRQLLLLPPGRYWLAMSLARPSPSAAAADEDGVGLAWQLSCADGGAVLANLPLQGRGAGRVSVPFAVGAGCAAQWLALRGIAGNFGRPVELSITGLTISRVGAR